MKKSTISTILMIAAIAVTATATQPTVVYPTGVFPTDVQNVQAAIDQGGTVLLKATDSFGNPLAFNFGPAVIPSFGWAVIENDISIVGEATATSRTTINGGFAPFRVVGGRNSITGIRFDGPIAGAITILASAGTSVIGNEIQNVVPQFLGYLGFTLANPIAVFPQVGRPASDISGNLIISGNTFGDLTGNFSIAIQVDSVAANVTILNNTFQLGQLVSDLGFNSSAAIACVRCHSPVTISDNTITIGPGIVYSGITTIGGPDARYHVFSNTINSQGPITDGIDVIGQTGDPGPTVAAVIEGNTINLLNVDVPEGSGIGLLGTVTNSTIQGNVVTGNGPTALFALGSIAPGEQVSNNRLLFNDVTRLTPSVATIFFDEQSANNVVRGQCVSVIDLGVGNDISCPGPRGNPASIPGVISARQQIFQHALQSQEAVRASITGQSSRR